MREDPVLAAAKKDRFHALRAVNAQLAELLQNDRAEQESLVATSRKEVSANALLTRAITRSAFIRKRCCAGS